MKRNTEVVQEIIPELRNQNWIQAPSVPPASPVRLKRRPRVTPHQPSPLVRLNRRTRVIPHQPPPTNVVPAGAPVRERPRVVNALEVRGLIPHIAQLMRDVGVLKSASVVIEKTHGSVYLCRFDIVARPDPVLPVVGLHWPRSVWDGHSSVAIDIVQTLRRAYADIAWALMNYPGMGTQRGSIHEKRFQRAISEGTNDLLGVLANGSDEICTDGEYKFVAHHLTQAAIDPGKYR